MEIVMVITLALMGVYFFKSTELPKDLRERSAQLEASSSKTNETVKLRMTLPKSSVDSIINTKDLELKLVEMKLQKNLVETKLINAEIDRLTLIITTLEQELKINNAKNNEIQGTIDAHLVRLAELQKKISTLS